MNYNLHNTKDKKHFKYGVQIHGILNFHKARNWFAQTYGPCESLAHGDKIDNERWSFHIVYQIYMIYVKGDEELSWFKLKFGQEADELLL